MDKYAPQLWCHRNFPDYAIPQVQNRGACELSLSNSLHTNFRQTDVAAVTCDKKSGLVSVKLTNNSRWDLEFEKGDDAKTVAHALIS